jgi:tRNA 5-methylaminomethyl-2-thiouridine biosynthesis bifunctional protein
VPPVSTKRARLPRQPPSQPSPLPADAAFAIETGFGTGSFLSAWELFDRIAVPGARLHYVSVELDPHRLAS